MRFSFLLVLCTAVLLGVAALVRGSDPLLGDEQVLRAAGLAPDGAALLDFFRRRTAVTTDLERVQALVRQLGDRAPDKAERAAGELVAAGPAAVPFLRHAVREGDDAERVGRARRCLEFLDGPKAATVPAAAARVLAGRRTPGAAEALLAYLPLADDEATTDEVRNALAAVAFRGERPEPALLRALEDASPLRRAVAAEALCQAGVEEVRPALRLLLADPRPAVRLRVALALAPQREPAAVSALIPLLADLPPAQARSAEEYLQGLAGEQAPKLSLGNDPSSQERCRDAWAAWWKGTEGAALLDELKKRTLGDDAREKALGFIRQLGDDQFDVRQRATTALLEMGPAVMPILRQSTNTADAEVNGRIRKCLEAIEKDRPPALSPVTVRLAGLRRPAGAAEVLLAYLPSAEDEAVAAEVQSALLALALRDGKPDPALLRGLQDRVGLRRAAAASALAGATEARPGVRILLKDPEPVVRLRAALALVHSRDREAVPALIDFLVELPPPLDEQAEAQLVQLAGGRGPTLALGRDPASRQKCRDAWADWWKEHGTGVEMARLTTTPARELGYTIYAQIENGQVFEIDRAGKVRWQLDGLQYPADVRLLPGNRVLVAEYNASRVTERNLKNEILWERRLNNGAVSCQRLPNGHTFMATRNDLFEVDAAGKEVFTYNRPNGDILAGQKLRDGQFLFTTSAGQCVRIDAGGKEVKSFAIGSVALGGLEVLPGGRVLVPQYNNNRVVEYDPEGKVVWEATVMQPMGAVRLANGNTLVSSYGNLQLVELDRAGKVVWEHKTQARPGRVRRR